MGRALPPQFERLREKLPKFIHLTQRPKRLCSSHVWSAASWAFSNVDGGGSLAYQCCTQAVQELFCPKYQRSPRPAASAIWLSPHQRAQFDDKNYFEVVGCDSQKRYRIYNRVTYGETPNVYEIDDAGQSKVAWCFLPAGRLVAGDILLAQKIALETDEHNALAVANKFAPRPDLISITHSAQNAHFG